MHLAPKPTASGVPARTRDPRGLPTLTPCRALTTNAAPPSTDPATQPSDKLRHHSLHASAFRTSPAGSRQVPSSPPRHVAEGVVQKIPSGASLVALTIFALTSMLLFVCSPLSFSTSGSAAAALLSLLSACLTEELRLLLLVPLLRQRGDLHDEQVLEASPWELLVTKLLEF